MSIIILILTTAQRDCVYDYLNYTNKKTKVKVM